MINIKSQQFFSFQSQQGETNYAFNIPAENERQAIVKIITDLEKIVNELRGMQKVPSTS